jgi:hypothetical protein
MAMLLEPDATLSVDQRRGERVVFQRRAWCEHRDFTLYLRVADLGPGGLFLQTSTPFVPGDRLRVCLLETPRIVVEAEVVRNAQHRRQPGVGCRLVAFIQGGEHYSLLLARLCENAR